MPQELPALPTLSYDEAIARGFRPVENVEEAIERITGMTLEAFRARKLHNFAEQVNCLHAPDNTPCDSQCDAHGHCIIFYCRGGACSHTVALEGDL